ncbi:hypothetical protein, partial [Thalassospira permensis]|uniref:hypothetical protein n=1 Tax=Thalassospira permensis TaxID=680197 RepID=UPI001969F0C0
FSYQHVFGVEGQIRIHKGIPEPLRLKNIFPAKQHRLNGTTTNLPKTLKGTEIHYCLQGNTALS